MDFNSWIGSLSVVLFMGCLIIGFAWLVMRLITPIWGEEEIGASPRMIQAGSETSMREAA
jgi:hypothetical protein